MNNKKALILTFHNCPNYGAVLQAFGLYEYLKKILGHVEILNYQPESLMSEYKYINTYSLASIVMSLIAFPDFWIKRRKFSKFLNENFKMTPLYSNREAIKCTDADYLFVGSDQIWNPEITGGFDSVYFGNVISKKNLKVISYAASIGNENILTEHLKQLESHLKHVDAISVRETSARNVLKQVTDKKVEIVLDPTLLAGVDVFRRFVKSGKVKNKYLFIYILNGNSNEIIRPMACEIASKFGLKIIEVNGNRRGLKKLKHEVLYNAGPDEFISLLAHAEYVVTDSFHGTAFSLLFHRPFITLPHKTRGGRMLNLLSLVGLEERLTSNPNDEIIKKEIAWDLVDIKLSENRNASEQFLQNCITQ